MAILSFTHCSSDDNGGGGGGGDEPTDTPTDTDTDTGPSCDTELLDTTMTVGGGTIASGYGIVASGVFSAGAGSMLPDDTFSLAGVDYVISGLLHAKVPGSTKNLYLNVGGTIPTNNLVLQLDSDEFVFSGAGAAEYDSDPSDEFYHWDSIGLTWSNGQTVSVKLCVK